MHSQLRLARLTASARLLVVAALVGVALLTAVT
jgi:hypothetical protein